MPMQCKIFNDLDIEDYECPQELKCEVLVSAFRLIASLLY